MKYFRKIVKVTIALGIIFTFTNISNAMPYYDLRFEEVESKIVNGEYENLIEAMNLEEEGGSKTLINKTYKTKTSKLLNSDEKDAVSQSLDSKWMKEVSFKGTKYTKLRPIYSEVKGYLIKDYGDFQKREMVTILIPVKLEYSLDTSKTH